MLFIIVLLTLALELLRVLPPQSPISPHDHVDSGLSNSDSSANTVLSPAPKQQDLNGRTYGTGDDQTCVKEFEEGRAGLESHGQHTLTFIRRDGESMAS